MPDVSLGEGSGLLRIGQKATLIIGLLPGIRNSDITKIDEAIEKGRTILASSDTNDRHTSHLFELFGFILFQAFKRTNKIDESISTRRQVLERPHANRLFLRFSRPPDTCYLPMFLVGNQYHELRPRDSSYIRHGGGRLYSTVVLKHDFPSLFFPATNVAVFVSLSQ